MKVLHGCPVQATLNVLSDKWKVQAVWRLSFGPLRFAELRNLLRGVSEKVLIAQLRQIGKGWRRPSNRSALLAAQGHLFAGAPRDKP